MSSVLPESYSRWCLQGHVEVYPDLRDIVPFQQCINYSSCMLHVRHAAYDTTQVLVCLSCMVLLRKHKMCMVPASLVNVRQRKSSSLQASSTSSAPYVTNQRHNLCTERIAPSGTDAEESFGTCKTAVRLSRVVTASSTTQQHIACLKTSASSAR